MNKKAQSYKDKLAKDRNFSDMAHKFKKNIYGTPKGKIREAVLKRDLEENLYWLKQNSDPKRIIDVGGGQGQLALYFAKLGHHVTIVDISEDMLSIARQNAIDAGVQEHIEFIHAPLQDIPALKLGKFDLVLCHAVLEWVIEQKQALLFLSDLINHSGTLSLMYFNKEAQLFANMVYGNFDYVNKGLSVKQKVGLSPNHPISADFIDNMLKETNLSVTCKTGVRCFHDYLREVEKGREAFDELLTLELKYNRSEPFASIGRYTHLMLS